MEGLNTRTVVALIADDDADALNLVRIGVTAMGFQIVEAHNGNEAIAQYDQHAPDIAILDLMMPGKSGSEVCQHIRASESGALVPVMILTACEKMENKVEAFDGGADEYLTKPFHFEELRARVRALLRMRELNLSLHEKNRQLMAAQEKIVEQERRLLVGQLAGTAAHQLGQPLSAIMLNCHLIDRLPAGDERAVKALAAIKQDAQRMVQLIEKLRNADPQRKEQYYADTDILDLGKS